VLFFIDVLSGTLRPFDPWDEDVQYCLGGTVGEPRAGQCTAVLKRACDTDRRRK
jgi:hypothetical protein